jgi:hypothetical protein
MPFLLAHTWAVMSTQVRTGTLEPWKIISVRTENCLRQVLLLHFQTRRYEREPVRVARDLPSWD